MSDYKTFEELKEELGDKFEDYMYKANIELLNKLQQKENIIKEVREYINEYAWQEDIINGIWTTTGEPAKGRYMQLDWDNCNDILEILDKGE